MTAPQENAPGKLTVFYDGSCPLCSAEIGHYKRLDTQQALTLIDVSSDSFAGDARITRDDAMARFHVRLDDGRQLSGARGFAEVWRVIPAWRWLAGMTRIPGVVPVMEVVYRGFLKVRPLMVRIFQIATRGRRKP